jgi:hypothetical protein
MTKKKYPKIIQKGGIEGVGEPLHWDKGSSKGGTGAFIDDIIGIVSYSIDSIYSGINAVEFIMQLPGDIGTAFTAKNPPTPSSVHIE